MTLGTDHDIRAGLMKRLHGSHQADWIDVASGVNEANDLPGCLPKSEPNRIALSWFRL